MDLKIKDVAELLSISETTVRRWLAEGKIPAYRLNHQYRFNRSEIEEWVMRQKLTIPEMKKQEHPLHQAPKSSGSMQFSLYRALYRGEVLKAKSSTKEAIIREAMEEMALRFDLDAEALATLFLERERMMSTALGKGIAVPHTRDFLLNTHFDVILTLFPEKPIEFEALDGEHVHTLFFLFAAEDKNHLHLLAKLAHLTSTEGTEGFFRTQPNKEKLLDYVKVWEEAL